MSHTEMIVPPLLIVEFPIIIEFHLGHLWSGGLAALGFGLDRIRTLDSMATDSSHRLIIEKILYM